MRNDYLSLVVRGPALLMVDVAGVTQVMFGVTQVMFGIGLPGDKKEEQELNGRKEAEA